MAVSLLACAVSDLFIGKPALPSLPVLKSSPSSSLAVWSCSTDDHHHHFSSSSPPQPLHAAAEAVSCVFLGKLSMVYVLSFLCRAKNLPEPRLGAQLPHLRRPPRRRLLLPPPRRHRRSSLMEALDLLAAASGSRPSRGRLGKLCMSEMLQLFDEIAPAPDSRPSSSSSTSSFSSSSSSVSSSED